MPAARRKRVSRKSAAGTNGTSDRVTTINGGAASSSLTLIVVRTRLANANSSHCVGAMARRSEFARQVSNVNADWLRKASFGSGRP